MSPQEASDVLSLILDSEVELETEDEDTGIGPYEYGSARGIDRNPTCGGTTRLLLPAGLTSGQLRELIQDRENYSAILDHLHERSWGTNPKWSSMLTVHHTGRGIVLETSFSCSPPEPEPPDRELEEIPRWL